LTGQAFTLLTGSALKQQGERDEFWEKVGEHKNAPDDFNTRRTKSGSMVCAILSLKPCQR
jgi:hypothetical protein